MKIIINGHHAAKLAAALNEAQARSRARTLTVEDVERILEKATAEVGVSRNALAGTGLHYTGAEHFPGAYKYSPESTHFIAEHNGRVWVVTDIYRSTCPNRRSNVSMRLSESARTALVARMAEITV